ncbi:Kelch repeat and BTB domain-containing protein [Lachnellula occidentalis]|uniref:Kelch repeat and BTB domain-containing protein n=1 Tax=Lachnellula occidentalis TaxID=215460 RepID=A0A8H8S2M8_9HELO|nr:Kelch repeat and BTB domain-containing protein [Lachnellula occidentalis]
MTLSQTHRLLALTSTIRKDDMYADMTINCRGNIFKLHKNIVCTQSKPLAAAFKGNFRESEDSTIVLEDDELEIVEVMVGFLYEQCLELKATETNSLLLLAVKMYVIGDKYDIGALQEEAKNKFEEFAGQTWGDASFIPALGFIYSQTPDRVLKDIVIKVVTAHIDKFLAKKEFTDLCEGIAALALDVLKATRESGDKRKNSSIDELDVCEECGGELIDLSLIRGPRRNKMGRFSTGSGRSCFECGILVI